MSYDDARVIVLYVLAHELLDEHLEMADDEDDLYPEFEVYFDSVFAATEDKNMFAFVLDYDEAEVLLACQNHWAAFVDSSSI